MRGRFILLCLFVLIGAAGFPKDTPTTPSLFSVLQSPDGKRWVFWIDEQKKGFPFLCGNIVEKGQSLRSAMGADKRRLQLLYQFRPYKTDKSRINLQTRWHKNSYMRFGGYPEVLFSNDVNWDGKPERIRARVILGYDGHPFKLDPRTMCIVPTDKGK